MPLPPPTFVLRPLTVEQEQDEHSHASRQTGNEVGVVQSTGGKPRPVAVGGQQREDQGEKGEAQEAGESEAPAFGPRHLPPARRERTKDSTVCARAGGISFGFNIFRVLPVAR